MKLNKDITNIIKYELSMYNQYKRELDAIKNRKNVFGIDKPITSAYVYRIERFCEILENVINNMSENKRELISKVYISRTYSIRLFSTENYIDISSAYRWQSDFFEQMALALGYM